MSRFGKTGPRAATVAGASDERADVVPQRPQLARAAFDCSWPPV